MSETAETAETIETAETAETIETAETAETIETAETVETVEAVAEIRAVCVLQGDDKCPVKGTVYFKQAENSEEVKVIGEISGLTRGPHAIHIREFGDITDDTRSLGSHFNPLNKRHGGRHHHLRHVGDLGNVEADAAGVAKIEFTDSVIQLRGKHSIIGRGLVVHEKPDDFGENCNKRSQERGDPGKSLAWGIIGITKYIHNV